VAQVVGGGGAGDNRGNSQSGHDSQLPQPWFIKMPNRACNSGCAPKFETVIVSVGAGNKFSQQPLKSWLSSFALDGGQSLRIRSCIGSGSA
jgi:hypothetical protein